MSLTPKWSPCAILVGVPIDIEVSILTNVPQVISGSIPLMFNAVVDSNRDLLPTLDRIHCIAIHRRARTQHGRGRRRARGRGRT